MAAVSTSVHLQEARIEMRGRSDDEASSPHTRDTTSPEYHDEDKPERPAHTSSFSITNVLKKERDSNSPENVFSTEKLLQNTPHFDENHEASRNSESTSPRFEDDDNQTEGSRADISVDDNSCCSDDTVLSVGNEVPVSMEGRKSPDSHQGLTSFKHIQTHLNAISQLSQNLSINQPLLLRPNPINPNPLMFLNQPLIFQNPLINAVEMKSSLNGVSRILPQTNMNLNPQSYGLNFGIRKNSQEPRSARGDENRRYNHSGRKSPDNESSRDFMNQNCLKFSIDNILKADFGRRITDPLHKRKTLKARHFESVKSPVKEAVPLKPDLESRVPEVKPSDKGGAIDLSKADDSGSNQGSTTGTSSSDGPMVWPAWVYCTRYSDRPSSAKIVSFVAIATMVAGQPLQESLHGVDPNTLSCDPNGEVFLLLPHFTDCNKFFMCDHGKEVEFACARDDLIFDFYEQTCNWKSQSSCILRTKEEDTDEEGSGGWISDHQEPSILIEEELGEDEVAKFKSPVINCLDAMSAGKQLPYQGDCQRYWRCENGVTKSMTCQEGLFFNAQTQQCDFEANVKCIEQQEGELHGEYIMYN